MIYILVTMEKLISILIWLISTILGKTWRFNVVSPPGVDIFDAGAEPKIYCFWHSTLLVVAYLFRNTGKTAIVSRSKDGRIAADVARRWGHGIAVGSSARGGAVALRQSLRAIRGGRSLGITPDGPKGPREVVKPGAAQIAIASGTPAVTIRIYAKHAWRLKSWDRFMIPWPFAKITVILSEPIVPEAGNLGGRLTEKSTDGGSGGDDAALAALTQQIQEKLAL
jgi:lysophospholipid acyltransferase (LPLAT)-like uncharacterized protein